MISFAKVEKAMVKVMGMRTRHIAIPEFGFSVKAVPQSLDLDDCKKQGYVAEVHIDKRTIFSDFTIRYSTDYGALTAALELHKRDLQAQLDEIERLFDDPSLG
jgi:hypothetical protein